MDRKDQFVAAKPELLDRYRQLAEERPGEAALVLERGEFKGTTRTWAWIAERSEQLSRRLRSCFAMPGTRCAVTLADNPDFIPLLLALWQHSAIAVLVDGTWGERRRDRVIAHSGATLGVSVDNDVEIGFIDNTSDQRTAGILPAGTAMLGYTSGSTGDPKCVAFTHDKLALTMAAAAAAVVRHSGAAPRRIACSMRLSGSGVLNLHYIWAAFADSAVVVLPELTFENAEQYWNRIEAYGIEQTFLVPPLVELINQLAKPRAHSSPAPVCLAGSAPLSLRTQQRFHERFRLPLLNAYGLSETMCAAFFGECDEDGLASNSIGRPALLQARLVDGEGRIVEGPGSGELELSGRTIFDGYYGNAAATEQSFRGRWFRTGDIARRDRHGRYFIVGRAKDVVMKGGFSVYLHEIEESALAVDGVIEAAAVAIRQLESNEDIGLIVRVDHSARLSMRGVREFVAQDVGVHRAPYRVVLSDAPLPRTGQEKLDRVALTGLWETLTRGAGR